MKLEDLSDICKQPLKNPKGILDRLKEYNDILLEFLDLTPDEKTLMNKAMRDSQTYKMVKEPTKKLDRITWSLISNMDLYK